MLKTLLLSLLISNNWPLDIAKTGICASDEVLIAPTLVRVVSKHLGYSCIGKHKYHFLFLEVPPGGLSSLCRLAIESASYNEISAASYNENGYVPLGCDWSMTHRKSTMSRGRRCLNNCSRPSGTRISSVYLGRRLHKSTVGLLWVIRTSTRTDSPAALNHLLQISIRS